VYFAFDGEDFDPDEITRQLGIEPTSIRRKGDRIPNKVPRLNSWKLSTKKIVSEVIDVEEMALKVVKILEPKAEEIKTIKRKLNAMVRLEVVLWITTDEKQSTPAVGFNLQIIEFLAKVGAYIDIDTYRS